MRGAMIAAGAYLIHQFHWVLYVFGGLLVVTGVRMAMQADHAVEAESNIATRLLRRLMPVTEAYHGQRFFVRESIAGRMRLAATPLFAVLLLVETTDVIFAVDSIPAIFAITQDPFIVYSSNVFAILGLRALYFLLADVIHRFHYLKFGLSVVLIFVGVKMLVADIYHIPIGISLAVIMLILSASIVASWLWPRPPEAHARAISSSPSA
jgi:tellurite resistance protein TerC